MLIRSAMSGLRVLAGLRASVEPFPLWWAFPTSEYYARYDSPTAYGGLSLSQYSSACLPPWSTVVRRCQHCSVSGFPLPCLKSCIPDTVVFHGQERMGPPKFFDASLPACHGLRTPADLPLLAKVDGRVWPSGALKPSASAIAISKLYQHFRVRGHPCGLQDTLSTLRPSCSPCLHGSAMDARLATGGWLLLTRQGLAPCKRRQAFLGAITPAFSCCRKPEQRGG